MQKIQAVKGMNDLLPGASARWEQFEDTVRALFRQYGYQLIRTPIVEPTALFVRSIGEVTDIVEKEMYSFDDALNGDKLTLRPEATAGIIRAVVEHSLAYNGPIRLWTAGAMFRHERPQKGRYRQFHQFGVEAIGFPGPDVDAEQVVMLDQLFKQLGIPGVELHINSIGDAPERALHRAKLIEYFEANRYLLDEDAERRLYSNPLRILDTKNPQMQAMVDAAPKLMAFLGEASLAHFEGLKHRLVDCNLTFVVNPRLVRGLDYYNRSVFEFMAPVAGTVLTLAGGGRYDGLVEMLGGKPAPGCGFGVGIERVLLLLEALHPEPPVQALDVFVAYAPEADRYAFKVADALRAEGVSAQLSPGGSFKSQFKRADQSGARYAAVLGADELTNNTLTLKQLATGEQATVALAQAVEKIQQSEHA